MTWEKEGRGLTSAPTRSNSHVALACCRPGALALMASHPLTEHGKESPRGLPLAMGVMVLAWAAVGAASAADENRLPIGVRHVIAVVIEEYGFNCPAV